MRKILIPNGSFHDIPLIRKARELGYYVITSGAAPDGIGHQYADKYIEADFSDREAMLRIAEQEGIDRICSNCNDFGYLSACYVAEKLELGGHESYENALRLHRKDLFKKIAEELELSTPRAKSFDRINEAEEWLLGTETEGLYPLMVKAADLGAGQGIHRADNRAEAAEVLKDAFERSKCHEVVIEPFIEGTSHSFNAFVVNGKVASWYSDNEYMDYTPYRVSTSLGPADGIEDCLPTLIWDTEVTAEALALPDGLMHSQYIMDSEGRPHILEITRRMSGDWYPYPQMRATGIDWVEYIMRSQCGDDCSDFPKGIRQKRNTGRHCLNGSRPGIVKNVRFHKELEPYIYDAAMWIGDGFEIRDPLKDYPGIIFFDCDDREKIEHIVRHIDRYVELVYE